MALVSVQFEFEYTTKDGQHVSIKPNERYLLIAKTNDQWWRVSKDKQSKPFFVPAQYVKEVSTMSGIKQLSACKSANTTKTASAYDDSKTFYRFSTFGLCVNLPVEPQKDTKDIRNRAHTMDDKNSRKSCGSVSVAQVPVKSEEPPLYSIPRPVAAAGEKLLQPKTSKPEEPKVQPQITVEDYEMVLPTAPKHKHKIPGMSASRCESFPEPPGLSSSKEESAHNQRECSDQTEDRTSSAENRVQDESHQTAVYVNVAQLRQSISRSPTPDPSPCSPSYLSQEEWEVHVDQDTGQEYYYHPATGNSTWDNPFVDSSTDPPTEKPCTPSPVRSPIPSHPTSPIRSWSSDWEQLVDETSGQPYFYNPMSGETSWEPPELQSPYPPLMEHMSVHRFQDDERPPLPQEDYPPEDYPGADPDETYEDVLSPRPSTLPKEYTFSNVSRPMIPRANLDRSTPPGWSLTVEPNGTWVFTSENSSDQWIKSVDDQGQTYYYSRDGTRSQWNLPDAPVAPSHSWVENGDENENIPVIKNWRDSKGPAYFQDDGSSSPTHKRKTSDHSSDCSSLGNSPETPHNDFRFRPGRNPYYLTSKWLRYTVQNLEKAGILNKTKVCENGKKVRKNWTQTWTVLHGGVLTFHKDPKPTGGAVSGNETPNRRKASVLLSVGFDKPLSHKLKGMNKTNQIVPEFTVDLKGATIGRATKDKSSKKNVLELKGKNGVEFLMQYDTESIIDDWHKALSDTIRQLECQDHVTEEEEGNVYEKIGNTDKEEKPGGDLDKRKPVKATVTHSPSSAGETDPKKVRTKLMKFLMKRPTLQSVKEKGYIQENVFGCHLRTLCSQENSTVPSFVEKCIRAVERRGLDIDGLYRVSGNLATIQKLRFKANHEELDLEDGQWEDVHVITGALKLFFRELLEPLFPFSEFHNFISAIRNPDYNTKMSQTYDLIRGLPPCNHDTMKLLFGHLRRVIQYGEDNRMTVQNVAIVFGPTLLRPETETASITMYMIFQNQIVEFILNEYERLFHSN